MRTYYVVYAGLGARPVLGCKVFNTDLDMDTLPGLACMFRRLKGEVGREVLIVNWRELKTCSTQP